MTELARFLCERSTATHTHTQKSAYFTDPLQGVTESCVFADTFLHND